MKIGHLLFPALFFLVLISGAFWIMRTVEEVSYVSPNQTVYLESSNTILEVSAESVGSTREKAYQAYVRFADPLVKNDVLSPEEMENLNQILQLGEGHWGEENWAPAFYAFERVLNDLEPLIDEGLGYEKATEMEARYNEASQTLTTEIVLVESSYLNAIETANHGYNSLLDKDWISAIQSFAKAIDTLNLVKAQAAEIVSGKIRDAYSEFTSGNFEASAILFNEVLAIHPELGEAVTGLQLIQKEEANGTLVLEAELVESEFENTEINNALIPTPEELQVEWQESEHPTVIEADRHFNRRELKESLVLYLELRAKEPSLPGLNERISLNRKVLRSEELIRFMDKAAILVELGQWAGVIKTYRHILNVDPVHKEARRGWEEALVSFVGQKQIEQYKNLIRHHLNAHQFSHANDILIEARNVLHDRADFEQLFLTLTSGLDSQRTPVELVLISDGETWVSIPGKMAPEQFTEKEITLFPGKINLVGWKRGYKHTWALLALAASDIPESVSVICQDEIQHSDYRTLSGHNRVKTALEAYDLSELLADVYSFSTWVQMGGKMDRPLGREYLVEDWNRRLFSKVYAALNQQAEQAFELIHLDARGHFLKVPNGLTRKETIELGQYLASLD